MPNIGHELLSSINNPVASCYVCAQMESIVDMLAKGHLDLVREVADEVTRFHALEMAVSDDGEFVATDRRLFPG